MTTYQRLLMDSATLGLIERIIKDHDGASVADAAKNDKQALNEIKMVIKQKEQ